MDLSCSRSKEQAEKLQETVPRRMTLIEETSGNLRGTPFLQNVYRWAKRFIVVKELDAIGAGRVVK
jgi:hypothetical protein